MEEDISSLIKDNQRVEKIKEEYEEFLKCEVFDYAEKRMLVIREEEEEDTTHKEPEKPKIKRDGRGFLHLFFLQVS